MENVNNFSITVYKTGGAEIKMSMNPDLIKVMVEAFDIELELLSGLGCTLPNGNEEYEFKVLDKDKVDLLIGFSKALAAHPKMTTTIMGVPINNN